MPIDITNIRILLSKYDLAMAIVTTDRQPSEAFAAYRRKAPSQVKRDHAQVAAHKRQQSTAARMTTRSMATCLQQNHVRQTRMPQLTK